MSTDDGVHSAVVEAERRAGVVCGKLSRRLHEAPGANAVFLARVESHERLLNLDEVEGDQALLLKALTIVRRFRSDATAKTKWLSEVPHIFSLASRRETAQEILRQARAGDADAHHPLTCEFMKRFEADLVKIAAGNVSNVPQDLLAEEAIMQRIPLSSQASEGVHHQSRLNKVRAPASAIPWIPASARMHQNIEWARSWVRMRIQMRRRRLISSG